MYTYEQLSLWNLDNKEIKEKNHTEHKLTVTEYHIWGIGVLYTLIAEIDSFFDGIF